ncbi:hypothetical protein LCGC14_2061180 [marine sediment metagenome]|uniref:Nucleotide-diphospho-sugar transferase domain-containing protein n=1 Tax=marine sediment metagenome TaxID=412755 RepID=A0A0F9GZN6_9ZZZZ
MVPDPRTIIVTAGCGEYRPWAARLAERAQKLNGMPCVDMSDALCWEGLTHPAWCKAQVWEHVPARVDRVVWLDADVFPARRMPVEDVPSTRFAAVPEPPRILEQERAKLPALKDCRAYCNAGVMVMTREAAPVMLELGRRMLSAEQGHYYDQSWLNALLMGAFSALPAAWNWMIDADEPPPDVINVHAAGLGREPRWKVLRALYAAGGVG